jgi:hypothetical protein
MAGLSTERAPETPRRLWTSRTAWVMYILAGVWLSVGCSPGTLAGFLLPWVDDKEPPRCKLSSKDKEVTVAIVTWFASVETHPDLIPAETELSERLAQHLRERFKENKEKVKIVPTAQVRTYQSKLVASTMSPAEVGKRVKADYVIALEISSMSLYEKHSYQQLFHGNTEISVKAYDVAKPAGEQVIFDEVYRREYPRDTPIAADGSAVQFRTMFIGYVARDLSKMFAASDRTERFDNMD